MKRIIVFAIVQATFLVAGQFMWHIDDASHFSDSHRTGTHVGATIIGLAPMLFLGAWKLIIRRVF